MIDIDILKINKDDLLSKNICPAHFKLKSIEDIQEDFRDFLRGQNLAYSSIEVYVSAIRYFLLKSGLENFTLRDINDYITSSVKDKSNYNHKFALAFFIDYVGAFLLKPYLVKIKMPSRKKDFQMLESSKVANIINSMNNKIYRKVAKMQYITGARASEAWTIKIESIDYITGNNILIQPFLTKGDAGDYLITERVNESWLRSISQKSHGFAFLDDNIWQVLYNTDRAKFIHKLKSQICSYDNELRKAGKLYGVDQFSSHYFRHLYSTRYLDKTDQNIYKLSKLMRHKQVTTTQSYPIVKKLEKDMIMDSFGKQRDSH